MNLLALKISGRQLHGFLQSVFRLRVVRNVRGFAGATRQCNRELVVAGILDGLVGNFFLRCDYALLGWRKHGCCGRWSLREGACAADSAIRSRSSFS